MMFAMPFLIEEKILLSIVNGFGWLMFFIWRFAYDDLKIKLKQD